MNKTQTAIMIVFHTAVDNCSGPLSKEMQTAKQGQNVTFVHGEWQTLINFVCFVIFQSVSCCYNYY